MTRVLQRFLLPAVLVLIGGEQGWCWQDGRLDSGSIEYQVKHLPELGLHLLQLDRQVNLSAGSNFSSREATAVTQTQRHAKAVQLVQFQEENDWKNDLILFAIPKQWRSGLPRIVQSWLRNYLACVAVYFGISGAWVYYAYWCFGHRLYGRGNMPTPGDVYEQMRVAMGSMPGYAVLPAVTEAIVERGWTAAYPRIGEVGLWRHAANFAVYMACVEFGVYWMHRLLHDIRIGYRKLHYIHHKYNKEGSLSPFAGLAFHPMDGIIQALPYCVLLLVLPMHFLTHELMLFLTGVWTTNIHDNLHARIAPIMGAGYHTIHHTTYLHNYGHYTIYMDGLFGTLVDPDDFAEEQAARKAH